MLPLTEQSEQLRINRTNEFDHQLATLTHEAVSAIPLISASRLAKLRAKIEALAADAKRQERCEQAMRWARAGLAEGCDAAMQRIAQDAGDGRLPKWGPDTDSWMALQPAVELHAMSLTLDDLLTEDERRKSRIRGL
jgi:hypothetical protein